MNRTIKFRAYHTEQKEWWYFTLDELMSGGNKQEIFRHNEKLINRTQFTGLHDKQGKEIYESDKVKCRWLAELGFTEKDCEATGIVKYMPDGITAAWHVKLSTDISIVWYGVVSFIKFYNQNKPS